MKQGFIDAVNNKDVISARIFVANELMLDPRGVSFKEMVNYACEVLNDFYEIDNGISYDSNKDAWNEDFLFAVKNDLDSNFSKERLDFYYDVASFVLQDKARALNEEESSTMNNCKEDEDAYSSNDNTSRNNSFGPESNPIHIDKKKASLGIAALGGILTAVGCSIPKGGFLTVLGISGILAGGYGIIKESKK